MVGDKSKRAIGDLEELLGALRPRTELAAYQALMGGVALFPQFAAVIAGLRPGMDCWVPFKNIDAFRRFAEGLGLAVSADCGFRRLPEETRKKTIGIETLCTTYAIGVRLEDATDGDEVHAFVAGNVHLAERMRRCGWYPVVANGRPFHKPVIDHVEFGGLLGYPDCCVGFFGISNNWNRTNSYAEALRNTRRRCDHRTNCFGKNLGYSLNFHMPCRFDCPRTIALSVKLTDFLKRREPTYIAACLKLLQKPVLSLNEREIMVFDGVALDDGRIDYCGVKDLFSTPPAILQAVKQGNRIEVRGRFVVIYRGKEVVDAIECRCDEFGPRVPLLLNWA
jgi:hypothetical protein